MKKKKWALIAGMGILVLALGGGYYGYERFEVNQSQQQQNQVQTQATILQQQRELEATQHEVSTLENQAVDSSTTQNQNSLKTNTQPAQSQDEGTTIFNEWAPRVVEVTCSYDGLVHLENGQLVAGADAEGNGEPVNITKQGSGTMFRNASSSGFFVVSNAHVTTLGNVCTISVPNSNGGFWQYQAFAVNSDYQDLSVFFVVDDMSGMSSADNGTYFGPLNGAPLPSTITAGENYKWCSPQDVHVGDNIYILGYPAIGGDTITLTDGIVSGYENDMYKTSAKIDEGNSGGAAILADKDCYFGIPTSATVGQISSIGYILDTTFLEQYFNN